MSGPLYRLSGVFAGYGGDPVLKGMGVLIEPGEFVSIIGPNGSGKSTLLRVMAGDLKVSAGSVLFREIELASIRRRELAASRSVVHQFLEQVPPFTVRDFVWMGRFPHRGRPHHRGSESGDRDRGVVEQTIELTGIGPLRNRRLDELSGGELQLVRIAHALAQNSRVILLDEPVSHLDMKHTLRLMDLLHGLHREGSTVITVLHDVNIASDYSSRVLGIRGGAAAFFDAPERVLRYDVLEALFDAKCVTVDNPITGRPFNYPVPGHVLK
ncbi:MAG: ABC transporter ATP-binding protein [Spirochaetes bacterium]|nr:ABC transporter ATP-binding protein [Spirochaetota bacterium]